MEFSLKTGLDFEVSFWWCPHSKVVSSTAHFIFDLGVLDNLVDTATEFGNLLRSLQHVWITCKVCQLSEELTSVVLNFVFEGLPHTRAPNEKWVSVVMPSIDLKESLLVILVQELYERHRQVSQEYWVAQKGWSSFFLIHCAFGQFAWDVHCFADLLRAMMHLNVHARWFLHF